MKNEKLDKLIGKLVLKGEIKLQAPLLIGCGKEEYSDTDIIRDKEGNPFIPATTMVGALRKAVTKYYSDDCNEEDENFKYFWGWTDKTPHSKLGNQSAMKLDDLTLFENNSEVNINVRDGIKIDYKTNITMDQGKFDYEVLETEGTFNFNMEVDIRAIHNKEYFKKMLTSIDKLLENGYISIGAKQNVGFGKIKLEKAKLFEYDFSVEDDVKKWLSQQEKTESFSSETFTFQNITTRFEIDFNIVSSLKVGSYSGDPALPDSVQFNNGLGEITIPGPSIKGAIRSRAFKIAKTMGIKEELVKNLFGDVDEKSKQAICSRVSVKEVILDSEKLVEEVQTRIKIDRFTGGTIDGALFDEMPVWKKDDGSVGTITIEGENLEKSEIGLLFFIVKDLYTGNLAIGGGKNIGRGFINGINLRFTNRGRQIQFSSPNELSDEDKKYILNFEVEYQKLIDKEG